MSRELKKLKTTINLSHYRIILYGVRKPPKSWKSLETIDIPKDLISNFYFKVFSKKLKAGRMNF
jgi:hypothetical protein